MHEESERTHFDQELAAALQGQSMIPTSQCLEPEVLLMLARQTDEETSMAPLRAHLAACARCRRQYVDILETWLLAEEVRTLRAANREPADLPALSPGSVASAVVDGARQVVTGSRDGSEAPRKSRWSSLVVLRQGHGVRFAFSIAILAFIGLAFVIGVARHWPGQTAALRASLQEMQRSQVLLRAQAEKVPVLSAQLAEAQQEEARLRREARQGTAHLKEQLAARAKEPDDISVEEARAAKAVERAIATGHIEPPHQLAAVVMATGIVRGGTDQPALTPMKPVSTFVLPDHPMLHWAALPEAKTYVVIVVDRANKPVAHSPALSQTAWTVTPALPRGKVFRWQVIATRGNREIASPIGSFQVLTTEMANRLVQARRRYAGAPLLLGVWEAQAGLLDDADQEFAALISLYPHSLLLPKLRQDLQAARQPAVSVGQ